MGESVGGGSSSSSALEHLDFAFKMQPHLESMNYALAMINQSLAIGMPVARAVPLSAVSSR